MAHLAHSDCILGSHARTAHFDRAYRAFGGTAFCDGGQGFVFCQRLRYITKPTTKNNEQPQQRRTTRYYIACYLTLTDNSFRCRSSLYCRNPRRNSLYLCRRPPGIAQSRRTFYSSICASTTRMILVFPGTSTGSPAVMTTFSPHWISPARIALRTQWPKRSSIS